MTDLSFTGATWTSAPVDPDHAARLATRHGLSRVAATCMAVRWPDGPAVELRPALGHLHDPFDMHRMDEAVALLTQVGEGRKHIRIITDYDVDGTTSSLLLQAAVGLRWPEAKVSYHIPDRFTEGYGFSPLAAEAAVKDGVDLIVTADIGVRDHAAIRTATDAGLDVLVADHHLPAGAEVPDRGVILCPPQRDCAYPNPSLAACGVSLKLGQALLADHPKHEAVVRSMLKLAAIGTVADMVSVRTPENRAIVQLGLDELNGGRHSHGLAALLNVAGLTPGEIGEDDLGFRVGPRINAAGRLTHADHVVRLLRARTADEARVLAQELDQVNRERQRIQRSLTAKALAQTADDPSPFLVVAGPEHEGFHRGVVGIVASQLKEARNRPVAVVSFQGTRAVGSIRSVPEVHAVHALDTAADLLHKYGGHPAAAGFSLDADQLDTLRERLAAYAATHRGTEAIPREHLVDTPLDLSELGPTLFRELASLGPFGMHNPAPRLLLRGVRPQGLSTMGQEAKHLRFTLPGPLKGLWWRGAAHLHDLRDGPVDLLGKLEENTWRGRTTLQFVVTDARRAA